MANKPQFSNEYWRVNLGWQEDRVGVREESFNGTPKGRFEKLLFGRKLAMDVWGVEKQVEADLLLAKIDAEREGMDVRTWMEKDIGYPLFQEWLPNVSKLMEGEYGKEWLREADDGVLEKVYECWETAFKKMTFGRSVNKRVLRCRDQSNGERYLPKDKKERNGILVFAQGYEKNRIASRRSEISLAEDIAQARGYNRNSSEYERLKNTLVLAWSREDADRMKASMFHRGENGEVVNKVDVEVEKGLEQGDQSDLNKVMGKVIEIAQVDNEEELCDLIGVDRADGKFRLKPIKAGEEDKGMHFIMRSRIGEPIAKRIDDTHLDLLEKRNMEHADITYMNALGMEKLKRQGVYGRELTVTSIYLQRIKEVMNDLRTMTTYELSGIFAKFTEGLRGIVDLFSYGNRFAERMSRFNSNMIRGMTTAPVPWYRQMGEDLAGWFDRLTSRGSEAVDRRLEKVQLRLDRDRSKFLGRRNELIMQHGGTPRLKTGAFGQVDFNLGLENGANDDEQ